MNMLGIFKGRRVFLTGHTGFKGSWLAYLLHEVGADVMGYALPPLSKPNHFDLLNLDNKIKNVLGDVRDYSNLSMTMNNFQPEFVFHLAAQALVKKSFEEPADTFSTNVLGSVNLLESVRNCESVRALIYVTSDKCYENVEWIWGYRENDRLGGTDPYSASKAAAELVFSSYLKSFFEMKPSVGIASTRAGNVIGGGDWSENRIIPDCIHAIRTNNPIRLRSPQSTRPWQHVLEPLSGYLLLAGYLYQNPKKWSGSWNFGPSTNEVRTVQNVAETIVYHFGKGSIEIVESETKVHEAKLLQLNCDKAQQLLNWSPRWNTEKTLKETALWYKYFLNGENVECITKAQISEFFSELS
jgi:CDP-glucose 4,6-dehydratase